MGGDQKKKARLPRDKVFKKKRRDAKRQRREQRAQERDEMDEEYEPMEPRTLENMRKPDETYVDPDDEEVCREKWEY